MPPAIYETSRFEVAQQQSRPPLRRQASGLRGRAALSVVLVLLLAATWRLYHVMPPVDLKARFDARRPFVYWLSDPDAEPALVKNPHEDDTRIELMSIDSAQITSATKRDLDWLYGLNTRGERVAIGWPQSTTAHHRSVYFKNSGVRWQSRLPACLRGSHRLQRGSDCSWLAVAKIRR